MPSVYRCKRVAGPGFLIVGDAAATLDPLSSFGVKKAMASGWVAAVVVNTCLRRPEMETAALQFFEEREREVFESYDKLSATWYGDERPSAELQAALEELRAQAVDPPGDLRRGIAADCGRRSRDGRSCCGIRSAGSISWQTSTPRNWRNWRRASRRCRICSRPITARVRRCPCRIF